MLIDLTHTLVSGMPVYPGDTSPEVIQSAAAEKDGFTHFDVKTGVHAGTHMDGPAHMVVGGRKLCDFPPERFIASAKLLDKPGAMEIGLSDVQSINLNPGDTLIIRTGFSEKFNEADYFTAYPVLTEDAARYLVEKRIGILGIDWPSPDREPFAVHKILLGAEILIIENLTNLAALGNAANFTLHALPMRIDADSAPVRVIAEL